MITDNRFLKKIIPKNYQVLKQRLMISCPNSSGLAVNIMAVDDLAMQGAMASPAMVLPFFSQNIPTSAPEGLSKNIPEN